MSRSNERSLRPNLCRVRAPRAADWLGGEEHPTSASEPRAPKRRTQSEDSVSDGGCGPQTIEQVELNLNKILIGGGVDEDNDFDNASALS